MIDEYGFDTDTGEYVGNDQSFVSDNPPNGSYDPFPDTSLGAETYGPAAPTQEQLGQQILTDTQRGMEQEALGRGIVQESLGQSILDRLLKIPDNTEPWFKGSDGSLAGTSKLMGSVARLLGKPDKTPTQGGVPIQLGSQPGFGVVADGSRRFSIYPSNTTRDGRSGTMQGGTAGGIMRTATGSVEVGGFDFLYIGLAAVGTYAAYRAFKALT
jgi:hypothetical protein